MTAATPERPARDHQDEQGHAEFTGWMEAQGNPTGDVYAEYGQDDMAEAFAAGMRAARDLAAVSAGQQAAYAEDREADEINREDARDDDDGERDIARRMDALDEAARLEAEL